MLVGHVLSDFYFQTDNMVKARKRSYKAVCRHGGLYALGMAVVLLIGLPVTEYGIRLCFGVCFAHFAIDSLKYQYETHTPKCLSPIKKHLLIVDQCLHFVSLAVCWGLWGKDLVVRWFVSQEMTHLPGLPVTIGLGVLCILRPVGILIAESDLRNYKPAKSPSEDFGLQPKEAANAGRIIGYLERLIVFILLLYQQFGAIAFVLTAKSVARFKEIEKNQALAEYYLIGTLMSVSSAIVIAVLLGLCGPGK